MISIETEQMTTIGYARNWLIYEFWICQENVKTYSLSTKVAF